MSPKASPKKTGSKDVRPARQRMTNAQLQQENDALNKKVDSLLRDRDVQAKERDAEVAEDARATRALRAQLDQLAATIEVRDKERDKRLAIAVDALQGILDNRPGLLGRKAVQRAQLALERLWEQANGG